ncbi:large conductance mechanosensitive channel protein MscL [Cellulomonas sp. WB94]|uniref:large conductance mechanosensitive channel protein MscL n=1 Tax=Cellulomonas sp. WB94 TaxID=2173174 RepID=UPI000D572F94|nr:large conductance mechanosensitive channel protein MscL [Cellulomonas sp. WB94]PVU83471.1 large conductance mechanosensitive channel protein MscL [Cellulomonas sp. WB94]
MKNILNGFKDFISRGNAIDLAVAVVLGAAFGAVVTAIVTGIVTPLIAAIFGQPDLTAVGNFTLNHADFSIGLVLDGLLKFLLIAAAVYFLIVLPINSLAERRKKGLVEEPSAPSEDILLLQEIRDLLAGQSSPAIRNDATPGTGPGTPPVV